MSTFNMRTALVGVALLGTATVSLDAQLGRLGRAARDAVETTIGDAVRCAVDDADCVDQARRDGKDVVVVDADGEPITDPSDPEAAQEPGEGVWRNYDFTPGRAVWFVSDFTNERVGRFPANQLEFVEGNMQIVELDGEKVLEVAQNSVFRVRLPDMLPEDFTLEFTLFAGAPNIGTIVLFTPRERAWNRYESQYLRVNTQPGIYHQGAALSTIQDPRGAADEFHQVKLQVDGQYGIMYLGTDRAANLPNAAFVRTNAVEFHVSGNTRLPSYIKDIVVAVGVDDLYDTLMETGEFTTRGIRFDFDSDVIRPESTPVLEQLRSALTNNPDLSVVIEGHTDDRGEDDYNLELSERRARAVVTYLTGAGVDESTIDSAGKGETEPVADNSTPHGRAENRRVVIRRAGA